MVSAKVVCRRKETTSSGEQTFLEFGPDYDDGHNAEWAAATPALSMHMTVNGKVADRFEQGGRYTLEFKPNND